MEIEPTDKIEPNNSRLCWYGGLSIRYQYHQWTVECVIINYIFCTSLSYFKIGIMNRALSSLILLSFLYTPTCSTPVHLFVLHKSDRMSLLDWYTYHTNIFGFSYVHGIDHNSTGLVNVLYLLRKRGLDITTVPSSMPFKEKRLRLTKAMSKYANIKERSFLVPLDIDEYIVAVVPTPDGLTFSTDRDLILSLFNALPQDGYKYVFTEFMGSYCNKSVHNNFRSMGRRITHFRPFNSQYTYCLNKKFFLSDGFVATDQGNHFGFVKRDLKCFKYNNTRVRQPDCFVYNSLMKVPTMTPMCFHNDSRLGIVHFGSPSSLSFAQYRAKARHTANLYHMDVTNKSSPDECVGKGNHYCKFLVRARQFGAAAMEAEMDKERSCDDAYFNDRIRSKLIELNVNVI